MVLVRFDWDLAIPRFARHNGGDVERVKQFLVHPFHEAFERDGLTGFEFFERGRDLMGFRGTQLEFQTYWNEIFTEIPENVGLLRALAPEFPLYALSNTNPWHADYLEQTFDWMNLFTARYYSSALRVRKPDPHIYQRVLHDAGVQAEQALCIDDRIENIEGARNLGFQTILAQSPAQLYADLADLLPRNHPVLTAVQQR